MDLTFGTNLAKLGGRKFFKTVLKRGDFALSSPTSSPSGDVGFASASSFSSDNCNSNQIITIEKQTIHTISFDIQFVMKIKKYMREGTGKREWS